MRLSGRTLVFGLVGHPVRHSLSPAMHNGVFRELGIDAVYVAFDVHPERGDLVADAVRTLDLRGCNLTVPFKGGILSRLDRVTRAAAEAQAVNTVIQHRGFLTGYNTDGEGFARAVEERFGPLPDGSRAVVLGTGGAGRAIAAALAVRGAAEVVLLNRTLRRARAAAANLARYFPTTSFPTDQLSPQAFAEVADRIDLAVNCTAGPATETIRSLPAHRLPQRAIWVDINYWQTDPPHLAERRSRGLRCQDGLPMLVHQGALSFELFTGYPVEASQLRAYLPAETRSTRSEPLLL